MAGQGGPVGGVHCHRAVAARTRPTQLARNRPRAVTTHDEVGSLGYLVMNLVTNLVMNLVTNLVNC